MAPPIKKRYVFTGVVAVFLAVYALLLLAVPRVGRGGAGGGLLPALSHASDAGAASAADVARAEGALARWRARKAGAAASATAPGADAGADGSDGPGAASLRAVRRMKQALNDAGLGNYALADEEGGGAADEGEAGADVAAVAVARPAGDGSAPLHAVLMAAPGISEADLAVSLGSLAANAPGTVLLLIVNPGQAASLQGRIGTPGQAGGPALKLWARLYSWEALQARIPPETVAYLPPIRRYAMYLAVLDELEAAAAGGSADPAVLWTNLDAGHARLPDALLLSDARDVAFQRDPFPGF